MYIKVFEWKKKLLRMRKLHQSLILGFKERVAFDTQIRRQVIISRHDRRSLLILKALVHTEQRHESQTNV